MSDKKPLAEDYIPLSINVIITQKNDLPAVELRKLTTNQKLLKQIISAAFHGKPIILQPTFTNKALSLNTLIEKGIVYRADDGQYYYNF